MPSTRHSVIWKSFEPWRLLDGLLYMFSTRAWRALRPLRRRSDATARHICDVLALCEQTHTGSWLI